MTPSQAHKRAVQSAIDQVARHLHLNLPIISEILLELIKLRNEGAHE